MTDSTTLSYKIEGPIFEIHINNPDALNSFTIPEFIKLSELFIQADNNKSTKVTLLTSSGKFFSTGVNIKSISKMTKLPRLKYYEEITSKNIYLVNTILNHKKLICVALNGPVIGLTAALVCLMDIIYVKFDSNSNNNVYINFPFASIGLVNECGVSASLPLRIGMSLSFEALCLSKRIGLKDLIDSGFIVNSNIIRNADSTEKFNEIVKLKILKNVENLDIDSIIENKKFLKNLFDNQVNKQLVSESFAGLQKWIDEKPQTAFKKMIMKSKL